jgi:hypothetical protein
VTDQRPPKYRRHLAAGNNADILQKKTGPQAVAADTGQRLRLVSTPTTPQMPRSRERG